MVQDRPVRLDRRLSAILAADVAGYSRLMHGDEEATHSRFSVLFEDAVEPTISEHGGRIVKNTGDGFLAEFPSAVEAIRAAVQFQTLIKELTAAEADDRRIAFRVGINVGDVIVEPHDIFGDDVNVAARLESIAEPGGICISSSAYENVHGKVTAKFVDLGEQNLKNISRAVRAYAVVQGGHDRATGPEGARPYARSAPRLSIVVLPFDNLSGDPAQEYFVDGVTESLTTDLSRIRGSFVIGRHTAFTFKGKAVDLKQIGHELSVNYVLEGSVQRSNDRLRINVQLVDAGTGAHLWTDRFDQPIAALFDVQDEIVSRLANQLQAQLTEEEARRSGRSRLPNSMDLYFQGKALLYKGWTPDYMAQAREIFERSLTLDPDNIDAMLWTAAIDLMIGTSYTSDEKARRVAAAEVTLFKVLSLAPNSAWGHLVLGMLLVVTNRAAEGIREFECALALDSNLAEAHAQIGWAKYFMGRSAETEAHINEAFRLSPRDIFAYRWMMMIGFAKLQLNADTEALDWFRRSIKANRNSFTHFGLAAALALLGARDEARAATKAGLALMPTFSIRRFREAVLTDNPSFLVHRERIYQGLRVAGVPEE